MNSSAIDLEPWLVIVGSPPRTELALWHLEQQAQNSLAIFSSQSLAESYAQSHCAETSATIQPDRLGLVRTLADCYQRGLRYATLDPSLASCRRVFILRDVLAAIRDQLAQRGDSV